MKTVLVIGANSLIGQNMINKFLSEYYVAACGPEGKYCDPGVDLTTYQKLDIRGRDEVKRFFADMRPELIINTASFRDINLCEKEKTNCWDLNVRGVEHILEAAQDFNPLYIQISSVHVFDGEEGLYKEDDGCKPINYFGKSMLSAERIIQKSGLEYLIARTAAVYGKSILSRNDFFSYVQLKLSRGETVKALKDHIIPPTCADELAMAIFQLVDKQEYGIYHIAGTQFCSYYEFALEIARVFNLDSKKIQAVSASEFKSPAQWPKNATFTLNKLYNKLNWLPSNIQDGLNRVKKQLD